MSADPPGSAHQSNPDPIASRGAGGIRHGDAVQRHPAEVAVWMADVGVILFYILGLPDRIVVSRTRKLPFSTNEGMATHRPLPPKVIP